MEKNKLLSLDLCKFSVQKVFGEPTGKALRNYFSHQFGTTKGNRLYLFTEID